MKHALISLSILLLLISCTAREKTCEEHTAANCPKNCDVRPPCETCSALLCATPGTATFTWHEINRKT